MATGCYGAGVAEDIEEQVRKYARVAVALGRAPWSVIVEDADDLFEEGLTDEGEAVARRVITAELAGHVAVQRDWPETTDPDRLTAAFADLSAAGIVAREDFTCCQNCGLSEIGAEVPDDEKPRGYAFYHHQDAEAAAGGGDLFIAYGLFGRPPTAEIGREVADALTRQGLEVTWDGDTGTRIRVTLRWQARRSGRLAALPLPTDAGQVRVSSLDGWSGPFAPDEDELSAAELAGLHLPWMPAGVRLEVEGATGPVTIHRDGATLVGEYPDGPPVTVGRCDGVDLFRAPADRGPGQPPAPTAGVLAVTRQQPGESEYQEVPLDLAECLDLLRRMPPRTDSWFTFQGASGGVVQMRWDHGQLWLETPDPDRGTSTGRNVDVPTAERMITILATEDRVAVTDLPGTEVTSWR